MKLEIKEKVNIMITLTKISAY